MARSRPVDDRDVATLDQKIECLSDLTSERFRSRDEALKVAVKQSSRALTREEYRLAHDALVRDVTDLRLNAVKSPEFDAVLARLGKLEATQNNWQGRLWAAGAVIAFVLAAFNAGVWVLTKGH